MLELKTFISDVYKCYHKIPDLELAPPAPKKNVFKIKRMNETHTNKIRAKSCAIFEVLVGNGTIFRCLDFFNTYNI